MNQTDEHRALTAAIASIDPSLEAEYPRDVSAELIAQFAHVSGDDHPLHLDAEYARSQRYGRVVAHGAMLVGFMSTASTLLSRRIEEEIGYANVSLGYDRLRFIEPVFAGDHILTRIRIAELQPERLRVLCEETCSNGDGATVAIGLHVMRFV
jgi:3-hydroxybutyryl-CoA dehydratase